VIVYNLLASGACRLYKYVRIYETCIFSTILIFFAPLSKVLNVHMHSWLPIFSCQPHHFSLPTVPSCLHFCHNTHCSPAPWQYQQFLATSAIDLSDFFHTPSNRRIWTPHVTLYPHISCNVCNVWIFMLGAVNTHFWLLLMFYHFFLLPLLFACYVKINSFRILSDDRSKASSKTMPPYSAIQSFLLQMRISSPVLKIIQ